MPPSGLQRDYYVKEVEVDYTHKKQSGGSGQFARVKIVFAPLAEGGISVYQQGSWRGVPKEFIPGVEKESIKLRVWYDCRVPVIDFEAILVDGASHDVDSSVLLLKLRAGCFPGRDEQGGPKAIRAGYEGRGYHSRRIYGRYYWRPQQSSRQCRRHGTARQCKGY